MDEKAAIIKKIEENPTVTLAEMAQEFGVSYQTLYRRMKHYGIEHGRKQGRIKGTLKKLKIDESLTK